MGTIDKFAAIVKTITYMPGLRQSDIAQKLNLEKSCVSRLIKDGKKHGFVNEVGKSYYPGELFTGKWRQA